MPEQKTFWSRALGTAVVVGCSACGLDRSDSATAHRAAGGAGDHDRQVAPRAGRAQGRDRQAAGRRARAQYRRCAARRHPARVAACGLLRARRGDAARIRGRDLPLPLRRLERERPDHACAMRAMETKWGSTTPTKAGWRWTGEATAASSLFLSSSPSRRCHFAIDSFGILVERPVAPLRVHLDPARLRSQHDVRVLGRHRSSVSIADACGCTRSGHCGSHSHSALPQRLQKCRRPELRVRLPVSSSSMRAR